MNLPDSVLGSNWLLGFSSIFFGILLGYIFGGFLVPRLTKTLTKDKLDTNHPLYIALLSLVRFFFFILGSYAALRFLKLEVGTEEKVSLYLKVFSILVFTFALARIGSGALALYSSKTEGFLPTASILNNIVRMIILLTGGLVALQTLGISVTPALTALGVGGIAFALGLQETLSNLFAGLGVLLGKKVSVGDYISLETGEEGLVEDINWRTTSLQKRNGSTIIIPNAKMSKTTFTNYSLPNSGIWTEIEIILPLGKNTDQYESLIRKSAQISLSQIYGQNSYNDSKIKIRYLSLEPSSVSLAIHLPIKDIKDSDQIRSTFIKSLHSEFISEGFSNISAKIRN
ncbi:mechanosensitive ion channel family protein [Leptospira sarikeiensis]|uniref:Mechanosensitive ion channel family protein n=1 Tax=Leptospira sarikeiensis TaxID=2484943 RepID=A0A4V3JSD9_9LEPT|nr:mechanosensitive ion channel domain-containing protein [Leptospira sarikeiensis]TGL63730.1 mechanosensitive ion channel family protein [Leptospira sarikeiensis]